MWASLECRPAGVCVPLLGVRLSGCPPAARTSVSEVAPPSNAVDRSVTAGDSWLLVAHISDGSAGLAGERALKRWVPSISKRQMRECRCSAGDSDDEGKLADVTAAASTTAGVMGCSELTLARALTSRVSPPCTELCGLPTCDALAVGARAPSSPQVPERAWLPTESASQKINAEASAALGESPADESGRLDRERPRTSADPMVSAAPEPAPRLPPPRSSSALPIVSGLWHADSMEPLGSERATTGSFR
mmetsp:Transcript_19486/g.58892  ORF Transcript_19486/g.58892 Transcript_19486/m.58892 type:complete len:249 (+) Transcript_19486:822-1568(+)|eukprot:scaffold211079_cov25-Tisochrysis_lutea.AAC.2